MKWQRYAYLCRFGRQDILTVLGRRPTPLEWAVFERAIQKLLDDEYGDKPRELQNEDD